MNDPPPMLLIVATLLAVVVGGLALWLSDWPWWVVVLGAPAVVVTALRGIDVMVELLERRGRGRVNAMSDSDAAEPARAPVAGQTENGTLEVPPLPAGLACPRCGCTAVATFLYGLVPLSPALDAAINAGKVTLGGCGPYQGAPLWACNGCGQRFGELLLADS